jgi:Transcriptional regulator
MTYDKIKVSALKLFSEKGFDGTTIKEIANESGLKPSSIYSHFTSKEEIFTILWDECIQHTLKAVEELVIKEKSGNYTAESILYEYYITVIKHFVKNKVEYLFLKQAAFFTGSNKASEKIKFNSTLDTNIHVAYFSKFFISLQQSSVIIEGDYREFILAYIGTMIAYLEQSLVYNIKSGDEYIGKLWMIFWRGIAN